MKRVALLYGVFSFATMHVGAFAAITHLAPRAADEQTPPAAYEEASNEYLTDVSQIPPPPPTTTTTTTASATSTGPTPTPPIATPRCDNACCKIRELTLASANAGLSLPAVTPTVPAKLAYDCITSVPYNQSAAVALLDSIKPYLDWQTTVQWIKDPPQEYAEKVQAPYDFWAEWNRLYARASREGHNTYANEYEFGFDLYSVFQQTHDGHFNVLPDSVGFVFNFGRTTPLVSVSEDGSELPKVYVYSDVLEGTAANRTYTPSPITHINGRDCHEYLLEWSQWGSLQDKDALWNSMFYSLQQVSLDAFGTGLGTFAGGGRGRWIYPGEHTTLTFENGTESTAENFARVLQKFNNITSPEDLYRDLFAVDAAFVLSAEQIGTAPLTPLANWTSNETLASYPTPTAVPTAAPTSVPAPGYPKPVVRHSRNLNGGYYLEGEGYKDVAVLTLANFVSTEAEALPFQAVNTYFIERAANDSKTKLIIDLSANGGGTVLQGYDVFKILFPALLPYGGSRSKATEAFDLVGHEISHLSGLVGNRSLENNQTIKDWQSTVFDYRTDVNENYTNFKSWPEKSMPNTFGPGPDKYTPIIRWNFSDVLTPENSNGIYVTGYLNRSNITTAHFKPENIVLLTDGYCASTCATFIELMKQQAGVKTVVLGGRPTKDIMQAVGGAKGPNTFPYSYILFRVVTVPFAYHYKHSLDFYRNSSLAKYTNLPNLRTLSPGVNVRDAFRQNDTSNIPLQFKYEPADCRIYYTPAMAVDLTAVWKTVADTAWGGVDHCVAGGLHSKSRRDIGGRRKKQKKKRLRKRELHQVRKDLDVDLHRRSMLEVWTGRDGVTQGGDGFMLP